MLLVEAADGVADVRAVGAHLLRSAHAAQDNVAVAAESRHLVAAERVVVGQGGKVGDVESAHESCLGGREPGRDATDPTEKVISPYYIVS